jgi:hypothetical protein
MRTAWTAGRRSVPTVTGCRSCQEKTAVPTVHGTARTPGMIQSSALPPGSGCLKSLTAPIAKMNAKRARPRTPAWARARFIEGPPEGSRPLEIESVPRRPGLESFSGERTTVESLGAQVALEHGAQDPDLLRVRPSAPAGTHRHRPALRLPVEPEDCPRDDPRDLPSPARGPCSRHSISRAACRRVSQRHPAP